jgi:hypothetical protein
MFEITLQPEIRRISVIPNTSQLTELCTNITGHRIPRARGASRGLSRDTWKERTHNIRETLYNKIKITILKPARENMLKLRINLRI